MQRRVKLERDTEGQFVEIPPGYEPAGDDFIMRKEGDRLVIEPAAKQSKVTHFDAALQQPVVGDN